MSQKMLDYEKKEYVKTRTMPGSWYLSSYKYKYNFSHFKPFFEKLKEKKLVGLQCSSCNEVSFPPKLVCGRCLVKPDRWVDIRETAQVATFSITYEKNPQTGETEEKPVVAIRHDGADTMFLGVIDPSTNFHDVYVGMPLKVKWVENPQGNMNDIDYYEVISDKAKKMELRKE